MLLCVTRSSLPISLLLSFVLCDVSIEYSENFQPCNLTLMHSVFAVVVLTTT